MNCRNVSVEHESLLNELIYGICREKNGLFLLGKSAFCAFYLRKSDFSTIY